MPSWRAFTGQSVEQIQGWGWADALHPDDRQRTAAVWSQAVATRSLYTVEYRLRRHDGQYRWLSVRGVPVLAGDIPIIFLTGHGSTPMGVGAMKQGAVDSLTKPVDDEVLLQTIHQALARHAAVVQERSERRQEAEDASSRVLYSPTVASQTARATARTPYGARNRAILVRRRCAGPTPPLRATARGRAQRRVGLKSNSQWGPRRAS